MTLKRRITLKNKSILSVLLCMVPLFVGVVLYQSLPSTIAVHFSSNNQANSFAPKAVVVFLLPIVFIIVQLTIIKINTIFQDGPKIFKIIFWFMPIIANVTYFIIFSFAQGVNVNVGRVICLMIGILFILMGNYFPKMNYQNNKAYIHPTPKNEKEFRTMLKIVGYSFLTLGIIFVIFSFFIQ